MKDFVSKKLAVAIRKDIKSNEDLIKLLTLETTEYGANNEAKINAIKTRNESLKELIK